MQTPQDHEGGRNSAEEDENLLGGGPAPTDGIQNLSLDANSPSGVGLEPAPVISPSALTQPLPPTPVLVSNSKSNPIQVPASPKLATFEFPFKINQGIPGPIVVGEQQRSTSAGVATAQPQPPSSLLNGQNDSKGGEPVSTTPTNFSSLSATQVATYLKDRIQALPAQIWVDEDFSGAAILEAVSPQLLNTMLEQILQIKSTLMRTRVEIIIHALIANDPSISSEIKSSWLQCRLDQQQALAARVKLSRISAEILQESPIAPQTLFQSPVSTAAQSTSTPATAHSHVPDKSTASYSFLSEVYGAVSSDHGFSCEGAAMFNSNPSVTPCQVVHRAAGGSAASATAGSGNQTIEIKFVQPSANSPNWITLETAHDADLFHTWLRKNRKITLTAAEGDKRLLRTLVEQDVKEEVCRIILEALSSDPELFEGMPRPTGWDDVSDLLLLRILFAINGPSTAEEAKDRLKQRKFKFDDSTTSQDKFTDKLRTHCNVFRTSIRDLGYNSKKWPEGNKELTHAMIIECFKWTFIDPTLITGPDGRSQVPKCRNAGNIVHLIQERKAMHLNELIDFIVKKYSAIDASVRSIREVKYEVSPWNSKPAKQNNFRGNRDNRKRNFNELETREPRSQPSNYLDKGKPPRPERPEKRPAFARCNNCGSKGHLCGEKTCYLFGHAKGRGMDGSWPEGTESLRLSEAEWKEWKGIRHEKFYSYPENRHRKPANK
jgi:hypothetical protein